MEKQIYLSDKQTGKRYNVNRTTIWRWLSLGNFPAPIRLSSGCTRWKLSDLEEWETEKINNSKREKEDRVSTIIPELNKQNFEKISVDILELSVRAGNVIKRAGINYVEELYAMDLDELKKINGCGRKTIKEIEDILIDPTSDYYFGDNKKINKELIKIRNRYMVI